MSFSKHTNIICVVITVLAVVITVIFMNAESLGVKKVTSDLAADEEGIFSERDMDAGYSQSSSIRIDLDDIDGYESGGAYELNGDLYIATAGTFVLNGTLTDHQIIVDASDAKVQIVLDDVTITHSSLPCIYVKDADKLFLTLEEGSTNILSSYKLDEEAANEADADAAVFSTCDLTVNGSGDLIITAEGGHGIKSRDDLVFTGGNIKVTADLNALVGRDSVRICDGSFDLTAGNDAIKANNDSNAKKGYIVITGGDLTINSEHDAIQAVTYIDIRGGNFDITSGGGYENAAAHSEEMPMGGGDRGAGGGGRGMFAMKDGDERPEDGDAPERPEGGEMPERPEGGEMPGRPEDGEMPQMPEGMPDMPGGMPGDEEMPEMPQADRADSVTDEAGNEDDNEDAGSDSAKGLKAGTDISISGGTLNINSSDDAIHSDDTLTISGGEISIAAGDDGIHADNEVSIKAGEVTVTESYEGIEAYDINIYGGDISITASDDGMNAGGGSSDMGFMNMGGKGPGLEASKEKSSDEEDQDPKDDDTDETETKIQCLAIYGGNIYVNADGDGLDSNGDLIINGGYIVVDGPENSGNGPLDSGSESGGELIVNGGTILAVGSSGMLEAFSSSSEQNSFALVLDDAYSSKDLITISDGDGNVIFEHTAVKKGEALIFSSPELELNATYTVKAGDSSKEISLDSVSTSSGISSQGGMGGMGGMNGAGHKGGMRER